MTKTTPIELAREILEINPHRRLERYVEITKQLAQLLIDEDDPDIPQEKDFTRDDVLSLIKRIKQQTREEAYQQGHAEGVRERREKDAVIVEERGEGVGGGLDPELTAKAIRESE